MKEEELNKKWEKNIGTKTISCHYERKFKNTYSFHVN